MKNDSLIPNATSAAHASMHEAQWYIKKKGTTVQCVLCPHHCVIRHEQYGRCNARYNHNGTLYSTTYAHCVALHLDPIEKKPLYHFFPGTHILSLGTGGCNFSCTFCQNFSISQRRVDELETIVVSPHDLLSFLRKNAKQTCSVAYTYNEPLINYEYVYDCATLLHTHGYKNILVTNGYISQEPLQKLLPYIDAANVDIKAFSDDFYRKYCGGSLQPVLDSITQMHAAGVWVELTNLLIPSCNDDEKDITALAQWVASLDKKIPLHFSRYFPAHTMDFPPTPVATLQNASRIASAYLDYVYLGNVSEGNITYCPSCKRSVITREGYSVTHHALTGKTCKHCGGIVEIKTNA